MDGSFAAATRVVLADDHRMVAEGVRSLLLHCFDTVDIVISGEDLVEFVPVHRPDLVVADISFPGMNGIDAMSTVHSRGTSVPFLFLTMHADPELAAAAMNAGGSGYVLKSVAGEELIAAIAEVIAGGTYVSPTLVASTLRIGRHRVALTARKQEILNCVMSGLRPKQIAFKLGLSVRTVESHKRDLMDELGVHSTVELVLKAAELGLQLPSRSNFARRPTIPVDQPSVRINEKYKNLT